MSTWLRQNTITAVALGPFVDSTDGFTPETALSLVQAECRLKKNDAAWGPKNEATTATHEEEGWYEVNLNATDTNTLGILILAVYVAGALPVWREFQVVPAAVYDAYFSTGVLAVNVIQVAGTAQTAGDIIGDTNDIQARLPVALLGGRMQSQVGAMAADVLTAAATAADFSTEVNAAVLAELGLRTDTAGAGDPDTAKNIIQMLKQIINTLEGTAGIPTFPAATTPANAVSLAEIIRQVYDEVQGLNGVTPPTVAAIADGVWDEPIADHAVAGSTGATLSAAANAGGGGSGVQDTWTFSTNTAMADPGNGAIRFNNAAALSVTQLAVDRLSDTGADQSNVLRRLVAGDLVYIQNEADATNWVRYQVTGVAIDQTGWFQVPVASQAGAGTTPGNNNKLLILFDRPATDAWTVPVPGSYGAGTAGYALGHVPDDVWDEPLAGHLAAGSTGEALNGAGSAGDPWGTALPGAYGAGSAGNILGNNLNATVASRSTHNAADVWTSPTRTLTSFGTLIADIWNNVTRTLTQPVPTATETADAVLGRDLAAVAGAAARSPLNALRFLRNKWAVTNGTLTVMQEDDVTPAWTGAVASDPDAAPVTGNDPV